MGLKRKEQKLCDELLSECKLNSKLESVWKNLTSEDVSETDLIKILTEEKVPEVFKKRYLVLILGDYALRTSFIRSCTTFSLSPALVENLFLNSFSPQLLSFVKKLIYLRYYHGKNQQRDCGVTMEDFCTVMAILCCASQYPQEIDEMLDLLDWDGWVEKEKEKKMALPMAYAFYHFYLTSFFISFDIKKRTIETLTLLMNDKSLSFIERGNIFCSLREALSLFIDDLLRQTVVDLTSPNILWFGVSKLLESEFAQKMNWWVLNRCHLPFFIDICFSESKKSYHQFLNDPLVLKLSRNLILGREPWGGEKFGNRELAFGYPYDDNVQLVFYNDLRKALTEKDPEVALVIQKLQKKYLAKEKERERKKRDIEKKKTKAFNKMISSPMS